MYASEKAFVLELLACLAKDEISTIPYGTSDFISGAKAMSSYYSDNYEDLGVHSDEIGMLFVQQPLGGGFEALERAFSTFGGELMTFDNPTYITAHIKLERMNPDFVLNKGRSGVPLEHIEQFAEAFKIQGKCA